ncbi:transcriptional regulator [Streptomyces albus subsp. albus]|nr:transcriptional regulator [Streptomyces albus subsp. albus]
MTRTDRVRAATGTAKKNVQHAAEVVAPYAGTAKDTAAHYAHHARVVLAPKVSHAAQRAQHATAAWYHGPVARQVEQARCALPPKVDAAATRAAVRTREAARQAADYTVPRVEHAIAVARPASAEAVARGAAAMAALRSQVTAAEIAKLARRHERRAAARRAVKRVALTVLLAGGMVAAWKWWDRQANPDWLVEPPAATELGDGASISSVDGSEPTQADEARPNGPDGSR